MAARMCLSVVVVALYILCAVEAGQEPPDTPLPGDLTRSQEEALRNLLSETLDGALDALRSADSKAYANFYHKDATLQVQGKQPVAGKDAIYQTMDQFLSTVKSIDVKLLSPLYYLGSAVAVNFDVFAVGKEGCSTTWNEFAVYTVDHHGKITSTELFPSQPVEDSVSRMLCKSVPKKPVNPDARTKVEDLRALYTKYQSAEDVVALYAADSFVEDPTLLAKVHRASSGPENVRKMLKSYADGTVASGYEVGTLVSSDQSVIFMETVFMLTEEDCKVSWDSLTIVNYNDAGLITQQRSFFADTVRYIVQQMLCTVFDEYGNLRNAPVPNVEPEPSSGKEEL